MSTPTMSSIVVMQSDKEPRRRNIFLRIVSMVAITSMIIPLVIADTWCRLYHAIYFRINGMPLIPREKYIVIDRGRLHKLNWVQRFNCVYCDYANGAIAWMKAVINITETYSCAIKHASKRQGQEHQTEYYEYEDFK